MHRVKILADLSEPQLERFVQFMEVHPAKQWAEIVKTGDHDDALDLILEGELRVRMRIAGKETILTTLGTGEFFGEISLFDHGPRSADVVANQDSALLKISGSAFGKTHARSAGTGRAVSYCDRQDPRRPHPCRQPLNRRSDLQIRFSRSPLRIF